MRSLMTVVRRPLDRVGSIKLKLGIAIVVAVGVSSVVSYVGFRLGVPIWARPIIAATIALALVQVLAAGMTSPLREMAAAARRMADGDWSQRVTDTSADEVGELARAFNAMARDLASVDRMRRDLVANVSHELRTPISALQARLENLVDGVEEPQPELLRSMLDQTERLGRLVAQLLDLSRLESGAAPLRRERVDAASLLDAVAVEARLGSPGREIEVAVAPADLTVRADPDRIHQVLANLTANALRFGPPQRPVRLTASAGDGAVVLTVSDEGPGISAADAERIFERFYRADTARPTDAGAGLGLAIARWIVDLHEGLIQAAPNHPAGCTMVVRLPSQNGDTP
ncbi:MAG TPA: ATP-binding protein [Acidimicrobiales bacterium]|nr:ATP-binding protein [Acidimicrobiales bacterium]